MQLFTGSLEGGMEGFGSSVPFGIKAGQEQMHAKCVRLHIKKS